MTWVAISDGRHCLLAPEPFQQRPALLSIGSIVVETLFQARDMRPQIVLDMDRQAGWQRRFAVTLHHDGHILIEHRQGVGATYASIQIPRPAQDAALRLTYAWHAPNRHGALTVENLDTGAVDKIGFDDPHPLPLDDIAVLVSGTPEVRVDPTVALIACSDEIETPGLASGFEAGTLIGTASGARPIESLRPGDLVQTITRGLQPVRLVLRREVPALGGFAPIRLCAPYFGLQRDICVSADHRVLITGADAEYLFGTEAVLVEARHLSRMATETRARVPLTVTYVQVVLDNHDCLSVAGTWGESLNLGDAYDDPRRQAASVLSGIPAKDMPRHTEIVGPLLKNYEAMVLVSAMSA